MQNILVWVKRNHILWFITLAATFILTRGLALDRFVSTDETPWFMRSGNFYYALGQRDFAQTNQGLDPGVTTMWINTAAMIIESPQYRAYGQEYFNDYVSFDNFLRSKKIDPHQILITARKLMLIENLILILLSFWIAARLIGIAPAFGAFMLIALDPFHIALTMVSHLDGQLSCLMLLSIFAFLGYCFDKQRFIYLFLSAVTAALACLTKLPGYILFPFFLSIVVIEIIIKKRNRVRKDKDKIYTSAIPNCKGILVWFGIFLLIYIVFWPAMWVDPIGTISKQTNAPFHFLNMDNKVVNAMASDSNDISQSGMITFFERTTYYPNRYLWLSTPVELFGVFLALIFFISKIGFFELLKNRRISIFLVWFAFLYVGSISVISFSGSRYMIPAMVILDVVAAVGWLAVLQLILQFKVRWMSYAGVFVILFSLLAIQLGGDISVYPYFYSYYNPLMGGGEKAGKTIFVGSGEGLDEAGRYLSQKPNASQLTAMSWYGSGCFSYYFSGKTIIMPTKIDDSYIAGRIVNADYLVVYTNQWFRRTPPGLFDILDQVRPEHSIWINGIEYVRIYKVSELPAAIYQ
jgi:hypothetical protein